VKPVTNLFKPSDNNPTRKIAINSLVIAVLFLGISLNFYIESDVHESVKQHAAKTDSVIQHERYKQVIDKTDFAVAQLNNNLSSYLVTGNPAQMLNFQHQILEVQKDIKYVEAGGARYVPKYLVNVFVHKANSQIWFHNEVIKEYNLNGSDAALAMLSGADNQKLMSEYSKSSLELVKALDFKVEHMNQNIMTGKVSLLSRDRNWNIISFAFMIGIALLVVYKMAETNKLNRKLAVAIQKEKHAQVVKDQFLSNMTHELRTPLNSILGYTNLMSKRSHTKEVDGWIHAINASGNMLLEVVNDVLDYSKLESGFIQFNNEPFDLQNVLTSLKDIMQNRADSKRLSFVVLKESNLPLGLIGDEKKLLQILVNLTGNAIKFTETGGIKVEVFTRKNQTEKVWLEFVVSDTGIGIDEDNLSHIFDRFYQIDSGYTRKYAGTGLGLPIVKQLVDMQGGSIVAKSSHGQGTSFSFVIPYELNAEAVETKPVANLAPVKLLTPTTRKKILVVDDHELNRDLLRYLLKEYKYSVETANNGVEAINILKQQSFDVILMDVQMPELNGIETTKQIRSVLRMNIPIIAFTAFNQPSEKRACLDAGMDDYLAKPVNENELINMLNFYFKDQNQAPKSSGSVDINQVTKLVGDNKEFINQVLTKAIKLIPTELESLDKALSEKNFLQVKEISHSMRSTLGLVGTDGEIIELVKTIEYADYEKPEVYQKSMILYKALKDSLDMVINDIQAYLAA
jgi:signal transduction histidine kinase/DNA-binding response OmpR family regulator